MAVRGGGGRSTQKTFFGQPTGEKEQEREQTGTCSASAGWHEGIEGFYKDSVKL